MPSGSTLVSVFSVIPQCPLCLCGEQALGRLCIKSLQRGFWGGPYTKSELGATATSRSLNFPEVGAPVWGAFHELNLRLVAIAPSSDFVLADNSIPQPWIRLFVESPLGKHKPQRTQRTHREFQDEPAHLPKNLDSLSQVAVCSVHFAEVG